MDPNDLRDCVESAIKELIEPVAWERCEVINRAERESLQTVLTVWSAPSIVVAVGTATATSIASAMPLDDLIDYQWLMAGPLDLIDYEWLMAGPTSPSSK